MLGTMMMKAALLVQSKLHEIMELQCQRASSSMHLHMWGWKHGFSMIFQGLFSSKGTTDDQRCRPALFVARSRFTPGPANIATVLRRSCSDIVTWPEENWASHLRTTGSRRSHKSHSWLDAIILNVCWICYAFSDACLVFPFKFESSI